MARKSSEGKQNQRGKAKSKPTDTDADSGDSSSQAPSRVHIFKSKPPRGDSSASADKTLRCSSLLPDRLHGLDLRHATGYAATSEAGVASHGILLHDQLFSLRSRIEAGKKALHDFVMKAEDLEAILQGVQDTWHAITNRRG
jgi:hypothetical protein